MTKLQDLLLKIANDDSFNRYKRTDNLYWANLDLQEAANLEPISRENYIKFLEKAQVLKDTLELYEKLKSQNVPLEDYKEDVALWSQEFYEEEQTEMLERGVFLILSTSPHKAMVAQANSDKLLLMYGISDYKTVNRTEFEKEASIIRQYRKKI